MTRFVVLSLALGCFEHHVVPTVDSDAAVDSDAVDGGCRGTPPVCVTARLCDLPAQVDAVCAGEWRCPAGSRRHARVMPLADCRPAADVSTLGSLGVAFPMAEGCQWVLDETDTNHPIATLADAAFGACPSLSLEGRSHVSLASLPAGASVSLLDAFRYRGRTWVTHRVYVPDPRALFGFSSAGTGASPVEVLQPALEDLGVVDGFEYGEATWADDDYAYLFGCRGPVDLLRTECRLVRTRAPADPSQWEHWTGRAWSSPRDAAIVLEAGPERWDVMQLRDGSFLMVFSPGFGDDVRVRRAPAIEGPWSADRRLLRCDLPGDDDDAFCREPQLHPERMDPLRPNELVVTYDVQTLAPDGEERRRRDPAAYWPRLVHVDL